MNGRRRHTVRLLSCLHASSFSPLSHVCQSAYKNTVPSIEQGADQHTCAGCTGRNYPAYMRRKRRLWSVMLVLFLWYENLALFYIPTVLHTTYLGGYPDSQISINCPFFLSHNSLPHSLDHHAMWPGLGSLSSVMPGNPLLCLCLIQA